MSNKLPGCHLANALRSRSKHILQWRYRNEVSVHSFIHFVQISLLQSSILTNLHLDDVNNPHTVHFNKILEQFCLVQHVHSITHLRGHTLDVVISRLEHPVRSVHVEPPVLSDHAFIVADIDLKIVHDQPKSVVRRRQWRKVDFDALREDLHQSSLLIDPPSSVAELFAVMMRH